MFKKIINFFTPKGEINYFDRLRINAFIIIILTGALIALTTVIWGLIAKTENYLFVVIPWIAFVFIAFSYLFLLKYTNIKLTGNISSLVNVLVIAFTVNIINPDIPILYKYLGGFYTIMGLYVGNVLFATTSITIIDTLIILATTTRILIYTLHHHPDLKNMAISGYVNHTVQLALATLFIILTQRFTKKSIEQSEKMAKRNQDQNKLLLSILENVDTGANEFFKTSELLSETAQKIAQNATEQAATTEEISSSMEEMLASVQSNTEKALYTSQATSEAAIKMKQNKDLIINTLKAVNDISLKILEISEIADKTDILSINAAIEAARAGESGKGFAVVAQEIRKLADRTQKLSLEISELSQKNIQMSQTASDELEKIIPEIIKSAELVNNITVASKEQEKSIESINNAILQLSNTTNENSASAEELSASAEELLTQAQRLKELSSSFKSFI